VCGEKQREEVRAVRIAEFEPIGHLETPHGDPQRAPSQASDTAMHARVVVAERFVGGLLGLERYEYLWLIAWLDQQPDVRPLRCIPRATEATGEIQGVFASRAPVRPNGIGLSLVRKVRIDGNVITVHGVDLVDQTPILDIKPWFADCDEPESIPR